MRIILFVLLALLIALVVSCNVKHNSNVENANNALLSFIDNVKTENKPFTAYKRLENYYIDNTFNVLLKGKSRRLSIKAITQCDFYKCVELEANEKLNTALIDNLKKALDENSVEAYSYLYGEKVVDIFERNMKLTKDISNLQDNYVEKFVSLTNETKINKDNVDFFVAAGNLYGSGFYVVRNYQKSNDFFEKAYELGNENVAANLSRNYFNLVDSPNSYLWRIRCTNTCVYNVSVKNLIENSVYIERLSTEQIKDIQEAALKKEILKI